MVALMAMLLAGSTVYGQTLMKATSPDGVPARSRDGAGREGTAPAFVHGQTGQRPGVPVLKGGADSRSVYPLGTNLGLLTSPYDGERARRHQRHFSNGSGQQTVVFVNAGAVYSPGYYADAPTVDQVQDAYYQPGYQWGVSLSQFTVTWDQLLDYLSAYVVNAPPVAQDAFRAGFIDGFGGSGPATFDHAFQVAAGQ
jgi:hypothetical protein